MTHKRQDATSDEQADNKPLAHSTVEVTMRDTLGVIILGPLALILLVALLRAQARNRALIAQLSQQSR